MAKRQIDPLRKALKKQSTHQSLGAREAVYNQLGLSKPGFWVKQQRRLRGEEDDSDEGYDPLQQTAPQYQELDAYKPKKWDWGQPPAKKKQAQLGYMDMGTMAQGGKPGTGATRRALNTQLLTATSNVWKSLGKAHPLVTASSSNMLMTEKYSTAYALSQAYGAALRDNPMADMGKVATEYYFNKANAAAVSRANVPFGHGEPTQFEKMQAMLAKPKPIIKGNTGSKGVQQAKAKQAPQLKSASQNKTQFNVKQNGYASSYVGFSW